ncbi:MAG: carbohydrate-binding protein, partial [Lachnospiraceae bacterium]|nr:carbohydrate-binding protein [Lachnospiraceae bacterium]
MKRRRRIVALLLAVCLMVFYTVPAYADGIEGNATETTGSQIETDPAADPADPEVPAEAEPAVADPADTEVPAEADPAVTDPADSEVSAEPSDQEAAIGEGEESEGTEETEGDALLEEGASDEMLRALSVSPVIPDTVKIISYNMLTTSKRGLTYEYVSPTTGKKTTIDRMATFEEIMAKYMPDSFGACEVTDTWKKYLVNYCNDSNGLYAIAGLTSCSGKTLTSGSGEYSPVIYRSDRYDLVDEGGWWFSADPDSKVKFEIPGHQPSNGSSMNFTRVFSYAVLKYKGTEDIAYIHINAHTDHQSDDYVDVLCAKLLREKADYLRSIHGDVPVVISGDHNCTEFTYAYRYLADSVNGFADAKYLSDIRDNQSTTAGFEENFNPAVNVNNTIDHIYVSTGNVGVVSSDVLEYAFFSDHSGIISELVLGREKYPVIEGVETSDVGARAIDLRNGLATRKLFFETDNSSLTLSVNTNGDLYLNGAAVDDTFSLSLQNGANEFSLVTVLNSARTEYKLTVYKTGGDAFPVATEVYPGGSDSFIDITNLGGRTMDLADYEIFYGNRKLELSGGSKLLKPGETFIVLGSSGADVESFNDAYTKGLYASEVSNITGAGITDNSASVITIKKNGQVISRSDFSSFNPTALSGKTYKFALYNGAVTSGLFPYDKDYTTPGVYENDLGITVKNAYDTIIAGRADILGGDAYNEADRIASETLGSFAYFTNVDFGNGNIRSVRFNASVKGSNGGGLIALYIDGGFDGTILESNRIATVKMTETHPTAWTEFRDFVANLTKKVEGVHNLTLIFLPDKGKSYASNLATITFSDETVDAPIIKEEYDPATEYVTVELETAVKVTSGVTYKGEKKTPNVQKSNTILGTTVNGSTAVYKGVKFGDTGLKDFWCNLAIKTSNTQGTAHIYLYDNSTKGEEIAYLRVLSTDGSTNDWNVYRDLEGTLLKKDVTGTHDLLVEFEVDDKYLYVGNIDCFRFGKDLRNPYEKIEAETFDDKTGAKTMVDATYPGNLSGLKSDSTVT